MSGLPNELLSVTLFATLTGYANPDCPLFRRAVRTVRDRSVRGKWVSAESAFANVRHMLTSLSDLQKTGRSRRTGSTCAIRPFIHAAR